MAYAFGESYVKLPPITGESAVEINGENSKRISSGVVRDKHGLVRLPPIVRLDSQLRSTQSSAQVFPSTPAENKTEMSTQSRKHLKISRKVDFLRRENSKQLRKNTAEKHEDKEKLISPAAVKKTDEVERNFHSDSMGWSHRDDETARQFQSKEISKRLQGDYEALSPSKGCLTSRRGSDTVFKESVILSRSRRLAKSSPELYYRKISLKYHAGGNVKQPPVTSLPTTLSPENCSHRAEARLSIHDIDGSMLTQLQSTVNSNEKMAAKRVRSQTNAGKSSCQPLSTPNSPVCSESGNTQERKEKGKRSLNDITETVKQFVDRRRPSISLAKKQNLVDETVKLKIEGKSCPQTENVLGCKRTPTSSDSTSHDFQPPQSNEKRPSLYDLQQILGLLQTDDFNRQSSCASSPSEDYKNAQNGINSKSRNDSVYDLSEFLKLTVAGGESASEKQMKKPLGNKTSEVKTQVNITSPGRLSPKQEIGRHLDKSREGSVYDLKQFVSLGNKVDSTSVSTSENASSSQVLFSPRSSRPLLSVTEPTETRRSSTYNLMEFLSLPQSGGVSRPQSRQSDSYSKEDRPKSDNREIHDRDGREARSLSVYDLAEYLAMTSGITPLVRVSSSGENQTENNPNALGFTRFEAGNTYRRESVYDLREMLNVMQQEHEAKRESTYNLPEILAYFHRQADTKKTEHTTAIQTENSLENKSESLLVNPSPPSPNVTSRYSSDSPSSAVPHTDSESVEVNQSTNSRHMSVYDLKEFLSLYAAQKNAPNHQLTPAFRRKFSNLSQSGISIHVTDEWNRSLDLETDDVFLPVAKANASSLETSKRSSVYDLREFLDVLNADDSPLRRRLSSVSSASSKSSESESESFPEPKSADANSPGFTANEKPATSRPVLSSRQDSGGSVSLYDLGEFLSILNTDESPLRRRLSSASDFAAQDDSEKSAGEFLSVLNDFEWKKVNENSPEKYELGLEDESCSINVPLLPKKNERTKPQALAPSKGLLTS